MPRGAAHPCRHPGCAALVRGPSSYCPEHQGDKRRQDRVIRQRYEIRIARGSASKRGYDAHWTERRRRYLAAHPACERCGGVATLVHHIVPLSSGGRNGEQNLAALCASCHRKVHRRGGSQSLSPKIS